MSIDGQTLKEIRKLAGLKQEGFGARIGASRSQISDWERDVCPIPQMAVINIRREFPTGVAEPQKDSSVDSVLKQSLDKNNLTLVMPLEWFVRFTEILSQFDEIGVSRLVKSLLTKCSFDDEGIWKEKSGPTFGQRGWKWHFGDGATDTTD